MVAEEIKIACYHCGEACKTTEISISEKHFCCHGCKTVFEILAENNLCTYYDLNQHAGVSLKAKNFNGKYNYLNDEKIQAQLLDFQSKDLNKITFFIPSIHCSSCVWLLENFHKIQKGVISTRLNFLKKELSISYNPIKVNLLTLVELLTTLGYEPIFSLESTENNVNKPFVNRRLLLQIGVVGFCVGNIMLLSFPEYFKLDLQNSSDASYQKFFLYLNLLLGLPVFFFGASDYLKGAIISIKENIKGSTNVLSVDIPIALGITTLFLRSCYETLINQSAGYWDSLAGLVFFLLCGKFIQQKTYDFLSFERNYKSYFPLAVKICSEKEVYKNIGELKKGEKIEIHHQELIPADAILLNGKAIIDYSFVTGEAEPISKTINELIYAGGRQLGDKIELLIQKPVSQSYLTELWNNDSFKKEKQTPSTEIANAFSKYFTYITLFIAILTGIYWYFNEPNMVFKVITAVLMVACPCALTLSLPFTMNTTMAIFGKNKFFVKNQGVIQLLTEITTIVFDKTGTLTESKNSAVFFEDGELTNEEKNWVAQLTSQSVHPLSKSILAYLKQPAKKGEISYFSEVKGLGLEGIIDGNFIRIGSHEFIENSTKIITAQVFVEINSLFKGYFAIKPTYRKGWKEVLKELKKKFSLALLSGDNDTERIRLAPFFDKNNLFFYQKPQDKLNFIAKIQEKKQKVLMLGDGLNDAGALRQSNVGIALSEDIQAFSPACDAILDASQFPKLLNFINFSNIALRIVKASFILSLLYNIIGLNWAVSGKLSPVMAAIFMPLSSISVVLFSVGTTYFFAKIKKLI